MATEANSAQGKRGELNTFRNKLLSRKWITSSASDTDIAESIALEFKAGRYGIAEEFCYAIKQGSVPRGFQSEVIKNMCGIPGILANGMSIIESVIDANNAKVSEQDEQNAKAELCKLVHPQYHEKIWDMTSEEDKDLFRKKVLYERTWEITAQLLF